jgi:hypothetical protein
MRLAVADSFYKKTLRSALVCGSVCAFLVWHPGGAAAAFEIKGIGPQERGSATHLALGMVTGSFHIPSLEMSDTTWESSPAGGAPAQSAAITVYGFKPFNVGEIDFMSIAAAIPASRLVRGVAVSYQRLEALSYVEQVFLASVGFGSRWAFIQPAVRLGTAESKSGFRDWAFFADIYARTRLRDNMKLAVGIENPFGLGLVKEGSRSPQRLEIGLGFLVSEGLACGTEVTKESGFPTGVASGVEWNAFKGLFLRSGLRTSPEEFCFGVGFRRGHIAVDLSSSVSFDLGATHEAGVTWLWR